MEEIGGSLIGIFGGAFFGILALLFVVLIVVFIGLYAISAIGLSGIAEKEGHDKAWLAWIPIANTFLMMMLVEDDVHESMRGKYTLIYAITFIASFVIGGFFPPIAIVPSIMLYYALYLIANKRSENAVMYLIVSVVTFNFATPFLLFRLRNRDRRSVEVV